MTRVLSVLLCLSLACVGRRERVRRIAFTCFASSQTVTSWEDCMRGNGVEMRQPYMVTLDDTAITNRMVTFMLQPGTAR